ncbi:capsule assembly Wzi family protein [Piscinibacter sp. XHJ-5]|uniref:capsule assembly Wzi family protein n=1 Tax=Piscinibacter sp. XHJ-5 TaxID=3037797 RepID=UPI0024530412|nr:capsule assembly Wzi family protein [Piscinibacter sp. XHJ-5]
MPIHPSERRHAPVRSTAIVRRLSAALLGAAAALTSSLALADASAPWTPSAAARHRLVLLADEAGLDLPLSHWPLPGAAVVRALDGLSPSLPPALDEARSRLRDELRERQGSQLSLGLRSGREGLAAFGDDFAPGSSLSLRSPEVVSGGVALRLGARLDEDHDRGAARATKLRPDDSALAAELHGLQLQAWAHRTWWGPGWQSSLVLGHNAPPFVGVGVQRASASTSGSAWLSWLGPWSFEFFIARMEDTGGASLVGTRFTARPRPWLELGLTRAAQWGGYGRPRSFDSFVRMLTGRGGNPDTEAERREDPANAMAGMDLRLRCPAALRCAAYFQAMGEDEAGVAPSKYLALYGLESWSADGRQRYIAEYAATACRNWVGQTPERNCAYRNASYPAGYTHARRWVGAGSGPDSRVLTLGWTNVERGTTLRLHTGRIGAQVGRFAATDDPRSAGPLLGATARQEFRWGRAVISGELDWLRVRAEAGPRQDARAGITVRWTHE